MASFLQNNGDIILDAVLTDYGRKLLARGDGSFNIVKFALGDDEIDYSLFDPTKGTVGQDTDIMNTPILEAFTNNAASMKSMLLTLSMQNILYMPSLKLNTKLGKLKPSVNSYIVPINSDKYDALGQDGLIYGAGQEKYIYVDQGIDSSDLDNTKNLKDTNNMLYETAYNIYLDSRYCMLGDNNKGTISPLSIDDDGIAVYKVSEANISHVLKIGTSGTELNENIILGTQGSRLKFTVIPSDNLLVDNYFDKYGSIRNDIYGSDTNAKVLRMPVRVVGVTTGFTLEVPVMFVKAIV